jgi:predicted sulfurtransferase
MISTGETVADSIINLAAYKFVELQDLPELRAELAEECKRLSLKGTILLAKEGVNCFLAGLPESAAAIQAKLRSIPGLEDLEFKESLSDHQPFTRMLVKIKKEIITMGRPEIRPTQATGRRLSAEEFRQWLKEGREMTVLDTRNDYEVRLGTFAGALDLGLKTFRQFPQKVDAMDARLKDKPLVAFCTGGIRCEKATAYLQDKGFKDVYQLDGGILKYFEKTGGEHFNGECFVFDFRVAVDPALKETKTLLCYNCQNPVTLEEQGDPAYIPNTSCPHCAGREKAHKELIAREML